MKSSAKTEPRFSRVASAMGDPTRARILGMSMLEHFVSRRWLTRETGSRALKVTAEGGRVLPG